MAITEEKVTNKKYRIWNTAKSAWDRISFWTKASDVEFEDGTTAETLKTNVGTHTSDTIKHITAAERTTWNAKQNALTIDSVLSTTSTNPVQNKIVKGAIDSLDTDLTNTNAVVGGNTINLLPNNSISETQNGITKTVNADKSITFSGTTNAVTSFDLGTITLPIGTYTMKDVRANIGSNVVNEGWGNHSSYTFTLTESTSVTSYFWLPSGYTINGTYYPQIEKGTVKHDYVPYIGGSLIESVSALNENTTKLNTDLTNVENEIAVNVLKNNVTDVTRNGISFAVNTDGTVTANGTATATAVLEITQTFGVGTYTLSGCPSGGSQNNYSQYLFETLSGNDYGDGVTFTLTQEKIVKVRLRIASGYVANNLVFKPMIEKGTVKHEFVSYCGGTSVANALGALNENIEKLKAAIVALGGTII